MNYQLTMWGVSFGNSKINQLTYCKLFAKQWLLCKASLVFGDPEFGGNLIEMIYTPLIMVFQLCLSLGNIPDIQTAKD